MAEILGTSGVGVSGSGTSDQDVGATEWEEDLRATMETSDDLFSQYEQTDDLDFLKEAIALAESAVTSITPLHPDRAILSAKLRKMLGSKFEHTEDEVDLDMAWVWAIEEIGTTPKNMATYATACSSILTIRRQLESTHSRDRSPGADLLRRYERLGNVADLNEAIVEMEKALEACHPATPKRADMLNGWSAMLVRRFERLGDIYDLEKAARINEEMMRKSIAGSKIHTNALSNLGTILSKRFERIGNLEDLQKAIKYGEEAVAGTPRDGPELAAIYDPLGSMFYRSFKRLGDLDDLQKAIKHAEAALAATPEITQIEQADTITWERCSLRAIKHTEAALAATPRDHTDRAVIYNNLGAIFSKRFERVGDLDDLQKAIKHTEAAITAAPRDHPDQAGTYNNLGAMFSERFERIGDLDDLQKAIKHTEAAVAATPRDHPDRAGRYSNLGNRFSARFERIGDLDDLQKAIKHTEAALAATPRDHPDRAGRYSSLGNQFSARFKRVGDLGDLQKAIKHTEVALAATPRDHPDRAGIYNNLGNRFSERFDRMGDLDDLQKAIKHNEAALAATPRDHPDRAGRYSNLGTMLSARVERIGDLDDLQKAIKHTEAALAATPRDHPDRAAIYGSLGNWFSARFDRIGDFDDLQKAFKHTEAALAATPRDHPDRAAIYGSLGNRFYARFNRIGDLDDLQKAIKHTEAALAATPRDHPDRAGRYSNLGTMFSARFERIGDLDDLQKAIKHTEAALAATPRDHPDRAAIYGSLGNRFSARFNRIGDLDDLQKAIKHTEAALAATPRDHPDRAGRCSNLGTMLSARFERIGDLDDLQKAIKHTEAAVAATPRDHPDRATIYSNLGNWLSARLSARFERIGDLDDLQKAIKHTEAALAATPRDHPDRAAIYSNLGTMFSARFERIGDLDDLQKAIKHTEVAVAATPGDHPDRAGRYNNLGGCFESRYLWTHSAEDFNECLRLYHEAWHCRISPPRYRIHAARSAAHLLCSAGRFHESSPVLEDAIQLMPTSTAASVALLAGREAYHSLKLLELGRGIIMGFAIDSKSEVSDLKTDHRFEFDEYHRLRVEINSPIDETIRTRDETQNQSRTSGISRRLDAFKEMEAVLTFIRSLPGYGGFLLPPSEEALKNIAKSGPIVVFNSTPYRSDAIIVTTTAMTSLELPNLDYRETGDWMRKLAGFRGSGFKRCEDNKKMKDLLMWLWDTAVGPVLEYLESSGAIPRSGVDGNNLKRIWWIGVGQLSMAPFHAAGDHSRGSTRNTLSRVISTYIPTIKALSYARQKKLHLFDECGTSLSPELSRNAGLLLVPMPETPGATNLPGVHKEVQYIHDSTTKSAIKITVLGNPTPAEVLKQVQHHEIVHFACHGVSDFNPSNSHLVLLTPDGSDADKLLARDISSLNTPGAQLAYLSACSSAKNHSTILADEVIHLASAFQLAGFSHTLANLWETEDQASSEVARDFYDLLFQDQGNVDGHYRISAAFHKAVKKVRDSRPANYLGWAPFVHTGA
ncbi:TPR-like protein [Choiromyces venosus 120613-1]|uniref:TPR-like protein n=1 Tax=Choiromyces venosus 120613-1 TaxID=1336337 RepID=A0A3N4IU96_9PEZI|nr:TPR-like protein [Choiromyces venosus 120613-1]